MIPAPIMIDDATVCRFLDLDTAIESQRAAFTSLGNGTAQLAEKVVLPNPADGSVALCYLSRLSARHGAVCKLVNVLAGQVETADPTISATVLALHPATGQLMAMIDAASLTALRTTAASALAADVLAAPDADRVTILGAGVQGLGHARALARVRRLRQIRLWNRTLANAERRAVMLGHELDVDVIAVPDVAEAVRDVPIVATCTLSEEPVLPTDAVAPGALVISVGSFEAHRSEVEPKLVRAARVVVDDIDTALAHAGPIVRAELGRDGLVSLGDILVGKAPARTDPARPVFYNSVGLGVQDAAAVDAVLAALIGRR